MMRVLFRVLHPSGNARTVEFALPDKPSLAAVRAIVEPHLDGGVAERVRILKPGDDDKVVDLFIDEAHRWKRLPRNIEATRLYRRAWMVEHPDDDAEKLAFICGPAVVADRQLLLD